MKTTSKLIIFIFTFLVLAASAYAQSPRDELKQMVEQLQQSPNDNALREKIIKLATSIKPAPAIPEEAKRSFVKGNVFQKEAKDASGYELAIASYRDALRSAPWWGDAYFNLSVALEAAGKFDEAIASIRSYMVSVLAGSAEAREAQNKIYALEAKGEMATRQLAKTNLANKQAAEAASALIVPGKMIGPIRLGMTADEVQRLLGSPDSVNRDMFGYPGLNDSKYKRLALSVTVSKSVVTHIRASDERYATAEGVKIGISQAVSDPKMGTPMETFDNGSTVHGRCYFRDGGATWIWFDDGIIKNITVVPDCTYR